MGVLLWALAGCGGEDAPRFPEANLVVISIDTLRADHLRAYGYERDTSPLLDAVAAESVLFERAYSQSPKTAPSHMTILTSLHPGAHGVRNWNARGAASLAPGIPTLAGVLGESGYRSAAFTSGGNISSKLGFGRGFEIYRDDGTESLDDILAWVDEARATSPFFLFFHTYEVHDPYLPPQPYDTLFDPDYRGPIRYQRSRESASLHGAKYIHHETFWDLVDREDPREREHLVALYDAQIRFLDEILRPLVDGLDERGLLDASLLVVLSDHGEEFHEHGGFFHNNLHEEVLRVPLLFRLPEGRGAGTRVPEMVRLVDVKPTILDLLGIDRSHLRLQGRSLVPLIQGKSAGPAPPSFAEWKSRKRDVLAVRTERWKLIWNRKKGVFALYDIARDPEEREEVSQDHPEVLRDLRAKIERYESEQLR